MIVSKRQSPLCAAKPRQSTGQSLAHMETVIKGRILPPKQQYVVLETSDSRSTAKNTQVAINDTKKNEAVIELLASKETVTAMESCWKWDNITKCYFMQLLKHLRQPDDRTFVGAVLMLSSTN